MTQGGPHLAEKELASGGGVAPMWLAMRVLLSLLIALFAGSGKLDSPGGCPASQPCP